MRKRVCRALGALVLVCCCVNQVLANGPAPIEQWDRSSALAVVKSVDIDAVVGEMGDLSSLADGTATLTKLKNIETRDDWPLPAKEAAIYQFTRSLATLPRDAVAIEVIQYLENFQTRVLVPHEDHGTVSTPLFNVRGAAAGIENGWQRTEQASAAKLLIESSPAAMVAAYQNATNHSQRSGLLDALHWADQDDVIAVQNIALDQLEAKHELTAVIATTVVITMDSFAIQQLLINGRGAGLSSVLEQLDSQLPTRETAELMVFAIDHAPASNAALAIAVWWPRLSHKPETREFMLGLLADPSLGANAALALAQSPDLQTIKALQDLAGGDSIAANRARMALELNRARLVGDQP